MNIDKSKFIHSYTIKDRILEIKKHIEGENWQSALAMSLTLPDICGKIKYSGKSSGLRYKKWFEDHCEQKYLKKRTRLTKSYSNKAYFTGEMCWKLRNAFLHEGANDIKNWDNKDENGEQVEDIDYEFELSINGADMHGEIRGALIPFKNAKIDTNRKNNAVSLDIKRLCEVLTSEAYKFVEDKEYRESADLYTVNIVDYKKMLNEIKNKK